MFDPFFNACLKNAANLGRYIACRPKQISYQANGFLERQKQMSYQVNGASK
jgi:hypothetical protein